MTGMLSDKGFVFVWKLFSFALLLFFIAHGYALGGSVSASDLESEATTGGGNNTSTVATGDRSPQSNPDSDSVSRNKAENNWQRMKKSVLFNSTKENAKISEDAIKETLNDGSKTESPPKPESGKNQTLPDKTQADPDKPPDKPAEIQLTPVIPQINIEHFQILPPWANSNKKAEIIALVRCINDLSPRISLLDAATRNPNSDEKFDPQARLIFLETKQIYDKTIVTTARFYIKNKKNPFGDHDITLAIESELNKNRNYASDRFWLEVSEQSEQVPRDIYQDEQIEISERYAGMYMSEAKRLSWEQVLKLLSYIIHPVYILNGQASHLGTNEQMLARWFAIFIPAFLFLLTFWMLWSKHKREINAEQREKNREQREKDKEQREIIEFEMRRKESEWRQEKEEREKTEFIWRQEEEEHKKAVREHEKLRLEDERTLLQLQIEEQRNKLAKLTKTSDKNRNRRNNNSPKGN